uniref:ABC transporter ATP-binding protein n=1 Tax=Ndongobacter massiliensis TaxID=1871025 RepID=UPI0009303553|nr:ABC transporter ATP-binding protein [Ndongobacter massiliensis]
MVRKLLPYIKKYRREAVLSPLLMILEVCSDILIPLLIARLINTAIPERDMQQVVFLGSCMIGAALFGGLCGTWSSHLGATAGYGTAAELRKAGYRALQGYSFNNIDEISIPSLITRLTTDCETVGMVVMMSLRMAIRAPFLLLFAVLVAISIDAQLAMLFAIAIPAIALGVGLLLRKAMPRFTKLQEKVDHVNAIVQEQLIGIRVLKAFNRQEYSQEQFSEENKSLRSTAMSAIRLAVFAMPFLMLVSFSCVIAILWLGGQKIMAGTMQTGDLVAFITYVFQIMNALLMISVYVMSLTRGLASLKRIFEAIDVQSELVDPEDPVRTVPSGDIVFDDVCFKYPGYRDNILEHIDLHFPAGSHIGIIGSTGSSKSTLVQMIPRLYDVQCGSLRVGGVDVRSYDRAALREQIGFVLQKNTLVTGTIRSNMQWGRAAASDEEIIRALKQAQAWEFVSRYSDGLSHIVEQGGANFSGGQRQRLTIARALIKKPKILILDDSTSAVDMTTDAKLRRTFREEFPGVTILTIAQRIASIKDADQIVVLDSGAVESTGTHEELLQRSPIYREIYESQERGMPA